MILRNNVYRSIFFLTTPLLFIGMGCASGTQDAVVDQRTPSIPVIVSNTNQNVYTSDSQEESPTTTPVFCPSFNNAIAPAGWKELKKDYLSIFYPPTFEVSPVAEQDYALFRSPDMKVIFGVYSPVWFGSPDMFLVQPNETLIAEKKESKKLTCRTELGLDATQTIVWQTIKAQDGGYTVSTIDIQLASTDGSETRKTFYFSYADQAAYKEYIEVFEQFKQSLTQSAD